MTTEQMESFVLALADRYNLWDDGPVLEAITETCESLNLSSHTKVKLTLAIINYRDMLVNMM